MSSDCGIDAGIRLLCNVEYTLGLLHRRAQGSGVPAEVRIPHRSMGRVPRQKLAILRIVLIYGHDLFKRCTATIPRNRCWTEQRCDELVCSSACRASIAGSSASRVDRVPGLFLNG